ncbi:MAG: hypothetical protein A2182_04340 [Candidatus Pacebacteria bacterium RIFOXYA1_FULL_38_18]|nr:MAG: hypothetical protein A2182_04340 [Candidatus Pacebacteria bacterium RIFOXYA1_FULL_38_18]
MKQHYEKAAVALEKRLAEYLKKEKLISIAEVSEEQIKKLLLTFIKDFLKYQLFFDDFSSLCEKLLEVLQNKKPHTDSDLFMICHYGAELSWYIRNEPARAVEFLETMLNYYHKNDSSKKKLHDVNTKVVRLLENCYNWAEANFGREKLSLEEGEKIGVCITNDYVNKKITADELSELCGLFYHKLDSNLQLFSLLKATANLEPNSTETTQTIENLLEYFGIKK